RGRQAARSADPRGRDPAAAGARAAFTAAPGDRLGRARGREDPPGRRRRRLRVVLPGLLGARAPRRAEREEHRARSAAALRRVLRERAQVRAVRAHPSGQGMSAKENPKAKEPRIEQAGEWLLKAHTTGKRFAPLPEALAPRTAGDAYAIQAEFVGMRARTLGRVAGYKTALTTPAMRKMMGMGDSIAGAMLEKALLRSPAQVTADDYV